MARSEGLLNHRIIANPSIVLLLISWHVLCVMCHQLDSDPNELQLNGDPTDSAKYGWKVLVNDISKSWTTTKFYASTAGKGHKIIKKLLKNPVKSQPKPETIYYSPKRSSKCMFGTPNPHNNCGADVVASIKTNEYQRLAQKLWKTYFLRHSYNAYK